MPPSPLFLQIMILGKWTEHLTFSGEQEKLGGLYEYMKNVWQLELEKTRLLPQLHVIKRKPTRSEYFNEAMNTQFDPCLC